MLLLCQPSSQVSQWISLLRPCNNQTSYLSMYACICLFICHRSSFWMNDLTWMNHTQYCAVACIDTIVFHSIQFKIYNLSLHVCCMCAYGLHQSGPRWWFQSESFEENLKFNHLNSKYCTHHWYKFLDLFKRKKKQTDERRNVVTILIIHNLIIHSNCLLIYNMLCYVLLCYMLYKHVCIKFIWNHCFWLATWSVNELYMCDEKL